ncbi:hypothetical protein L288_14750 [Sphingobium quisquiliarum P25]|uniref:Fumarylacetoacetase-like C-terminal domain-containing protein n=1 Tax=Sphingobium quisquiliarum P25 TaxID=1329909 RepID=T0GIE6_9SPHN|nr:fumarylacetoacetate hydrolase family protein [Sphingobium quisquiliarum]EQB03516.1 hypothetical protein L288_14750 [Sphingobium quisquiliarum P25]
MRLVSYSHDNQRSWGAVTSSGMVIDLRTPLASSGGATLKQAIENGLIEQARTIAESAQPGGVRLEDVSLDPVIPDPGQILCIGLNYKDHLAETKFAKADHPTVFARYGRSQIGHRQPILRPVESDMLDYEGELAIVIGRRVRRASEVDALSAIAGYSCYNDASVRDFQRHTTQFHPGKNFPATGAFGPWLTTADEIPDPAALTIQTRLNGEVMQSATLDQLIFTIPELIAYCSIFTELLPGDVIVTGTPGDVGSARKPPVWMKAGDVVEVDIPGVGCLSNPVVDESTGPAA